MIKLDHDKNFRKLYGQLLEACDERLQALYKADYQGAEYAVDLNDYIPVFCDDEIDETVKETAEWLIRNGIRESVDDLIESALSDAAAAIDADAPQLADIAQIRSLTLDGYDLPMIVAVALPSLDDPTEYVIDCDPSVNGGNGIMHLYGRIDSRDCLAALTHAKRARLYDLANRLENGDELTQDEEDEISGYDYCVAICVSPEWIGTRVVMLSIADNW